MDTKTITKGKPPKLREAQTPTSKAVTTVSAKAVPARYQEMRRAIEACHEIDEVRQWHNKAAAAEEYARQANDTNNERMCAEIRLRAKRQLGGLLAVMKAAGEMNQGRAGPGRGKAGTPAAPALDEAPPTLAKLGVSKNLSSQAQKLAAVPKAAFEEAVTDHTSKPTADRVLQADHHHQADHDRQANHRGGSDTRATEVG